jgi:hypothetical protein
VEFQRRFTDGPLATVASQATHVFVSAPMADWSFWETRLGTPCALHQLGAPLHGHLAQMDARRDDWGDISIMLTFRITSSQAGARTTPLARRWKRSKRRKHAFFP